MFTDNRPDGKTRPGRSLSSRARLRLWGSIGLPLMAVAVAGILSIQLDSKHGAGEKAAPDSTEKPVATAGQTWTPLFDDQASISVGAVAIDPSNPVVIYAGTGEVNPGGGSVAYGGTGIFRSVDCGDNWEPLGLENSGASVRTVELAGHPLLG